MSKKQHLQTSFKLGPRTLPHNIFYAPLAGCSDYPFRRMAAKFSPALMYCEMVKMDALIRNVPSTLKMLDYGPFMRPIGGQICGSKPEIAGQAAKIIEDLGFDVIDFNCGCPVDKVTKDGSGSGMLKTPHMIGEIISNMIAAVKIPVTVKIRAGWDTDQINAPLITSIAEQAGAQAICVHGRTRQQGYQGPANWDYIKACKEVATKIRVIGNGDLFSADAVQRMFEYTQCDAVLISRGTLGHPWIVQDIIRHLNGEEAIQRTAEDLRSALYEHFQFICEYRGSDERHIITDMRRVGCWYLKNVPGARSFRESISRATGVQQIHELITQSPFGGVSDDSKGGSDVTDNEECNTCC